MKTFLQRLLALWHRVFPAVSNTPVFTGETGGGGTVTPPPPSGIIFTDDFDIDPFQAGRGWFEWDNASGNFVRVPTGGVDGGPCLRAFYGTGAVSVGSLHLAFGKTPSSYIAPVDAGTAVYTELYWRFYLNCQAGWTGGQGQKLSRVLAMVQPNFNSFIYALIENAADATRLSTDPASGTDTAGHLITTVYNDANLRWLGQASSTTPIFDASHVGAWYCIENRVKLNTPGQSDGLWQIWIDDVLEVNQTGLNWRGNPSVDPLLSQGWGLNGMFLENYWNEGSPINQSRYFDKLVVATQKIGPIVSASLSSLTATGPITVSTGTSTVTITLQSPTGTPVVGVTPTISVSGSGNTVTQPGPSNSSGVAVGSFQSSVAETKTVSVKAGGAYLTSQPTVLVQTGGGGGGAVDANQSSVSAQSPVSTGVLSTITITTRNTAGTPLSGKAVTLSATGTGNTLNQPGSTTNGSGVTTGSLSSTVAETKVVTAVAEGVTITQQPSIVVQSGGGGPTPWLLEDFSTYSSTANMLADPRGIYDASDNVATNLIALDTTTGANIGGLSLTQSMRYNYSGLNCSVQTITRSLNLPANVSELWLRMVIKHSADFSLIGSGCGTPPDWKMVFGRLTNLACRFELLEGAAGGTQWYFGGPGCNNGAAALSLNAGNAALVWDGNWHDYRWHWKIDTSGGVNHTYVFNLDGTTVFSKTSGWASDSAASGSRLYGVSMGRNMDQSKSGGTMQVWWGYVGVFNTNPGWGY